MLSFSFVLYRFRFVSFRCKIVENITQCKMFCGKFLKFYDMIGEQIKQIIDLEGIKIREFERIIGATQGVINKCIKGNTDISCTIAANIVRNFPQYSPFWLLTGEGPMINEAKPFEGSRKEIKELIEMMEDLTSKQNELMNKLSSVDCNNGKKCD